MSMLEIHQHAVDETPEAYHEFLLAYKNGRRCIYGFVEGKTDPSFYANKVQSELPDGWDVDFWPAGGKKKAIKVFESFDWARFDKRQVVFFVDRDFSPYVPEDHPDSENVYITDFYSIENNLVNREVCKRILQAFKGMEQLRGEEMDRVLDLFCSELAKFHAAILPISAHMIAWRRRGDEPCAENLKMHHLFELEEGKLNPIPRPKKTTGVTAYMCSQFGLRRRGLLPLIVAASNELKREREPKRFVRGKYELWFLVEFCESIRLNARKFSSAIKQPPQNTLSVKYQQCTRHHRAAGENS